jgi:hypothetical protein
MCAIVRFEQLTSGRSASDSSLWHPLLISSGKTFPNFQVVVRPFGESKNENSIV